MIFVSLLAFVMLAGFIGNTMVIATIWGKRSLWTPCNMFIMNIAISDLLVAILLAPLRMAEIFKGWPLGNFLCQFLGPLQEVIVCVSVVNHTVIALERYRVIVTPFKTKLSLRKAKIAIAVIYCACYVLTGLPLGLVLGEGYRGGKNLCITKWPSLTYRKVYEVYLVASFIALPLVIQTATYVTIVSTIKKEEATTHLRRSGTVEQRRNKIRKNAHLVNMLIILVAVCQVCLIPRGVFMLVNEFVSKHLKMENEQVFSVASLATIILYYIKHVLNPFILFAMSTEFRKNCFLCRKVWYQKFDLVSSVLRYVSPNSNSDEKEMKTLYLTSPETCKKSKDDEHPDEQRKVGGLTSVLVSKPTCSTSL